MATGTPKMEDFTLNLTLDTLVKAPIDVTFAALLEQIGPYNETPEGRSLEMKLEAWPGGRWYRDLGDGNGHFWATVQAIKRPSLLEFCGPLFASYPLVSNLQYRLSEVEGGTLIKFRHTALGFMEEEHKAGVIRGWTHMMNCTRERAEKTGGKRVQ
ncbi:MAG TPA: SRPBCC domain-containing protein [Verrucomicrobiae bacterium]|nr:SRPBCC domain-containing protein [Verrucomicrobiae bacterium]